MGGKKPNPFSGCTWESLANKVAPEVLHVYAITTVAPEPSTAEQSTEV